MPRFTTQEASIVALFLESAFWGVFVVTFGLCLRSLLWSTTPGGGLKPFSQVNKPMLAVCLVLPIFSTLNLSLNLLRAVQSVGPNGAAAEFSNLASATEIVKFLCVNTQTLIGDGMLLYRCWVVYNKSLLVIAFPLVLWLGVGVTAFWSLAVLASATGQSLTGSTILRPIVTSFWVLSITLNLFATSLIVYRIRTVDRSNAQMTKVSWASGPRAKEPSTLYQVMRIIIESGMLYTSVAIITFATYVSKSIGVYLSSAVEMQTVGIAFNLIIIRVHGNRAALTGTPSTTDQSRTVPLQFVGSGRHAKSEGNMTVTREVVTDVDGRSKVEYLSESYSTH